MRIKHLIALLCCSILNSVCAAADFKISGWHDAVVSVRKLDDYQSFFVDVAQWQATESGQISSAQLRAWGMSPQAKGRYQVYANAGAERGSVRLVEFSGVAQTYMRLDSQAWDSGGIYDINIRAKNLQATAQQLRALGWQAKSPVTQFAFGPFVVKEWIVRSPDGLEIALIERVKPELSNWPHMKALSRTFNSTQIVRDMTVSLRFYEKVLGFRRYLEHRGASKDAGPSVLGMPHNYTTKIEREVYILHPEATNEGSVELLQFHGFEGADYSNQAQFPNLGIGVLRFPVENIEHLFAHLQEHEIEFVHPLTLIDGEQKMTVKAPEGAWLEFYQSTNSGLPSIDTELTR